MDELVAQVNHDEPPPRSRANAGWVEVIAGSMFSGKSEELIRRLRRATVWCLLVFTRNVLRVSELLVWRPQLLLRGYGHFEHFIY